MIEIGVADPLQDRESPPAVVERWMWIFLLSLCQKYEWQERYQESPLRAQSLMIFAAMGE